jgi:hypothetical protein
MAKPSHHPPSLAYGASDPRRDLDRLKDLGRIYQQVGNINRRHNDPGVQGQMIQLLQQRRAARREALGADQRQLTEFDELRDARGDRVLVARSELLVRAEALEDRQFSKLLDTIEHTREPVECLEDRVIRLRVGDRDTARLAQAVGGLRARAVPVALNHVTPTGIVMKGFGGPEPSAGEPPIRPDPGPGDPVPVAIIDTGVADEERTDGWLTPEDVERSPANTDALTVFSGGTTLDLGAGHGTSTAGVVQQVAPDAKLLVYRALDSDGVGTEVDVACAMVQAVRDGARVVNLSLGMETADDQPPIAFEVALELIDEMEGGQEVIIVAAAGNTGRDRPVWPAAFRRVVAVAGLTQAFAPADWSTRGSRIDCSTLAEGVRSTYVEGRESPVVDIDPDTFDENAWALQTGTSFAAPQVAGAIARYAQEHRTSPREALRKLLEGTPRLPGYGRVLRVLGPTIPPAQ